MWLCITNTQAVKNFGLFFGLVRCTSEHRVIDVILLWRHSSLLSTSRTKWPIFAYLWWVLGIFSPKMWSAIMQIPKRHFLAWLRVIWVIVRETTPKEHFSRRVREKNKNKNKFWCYISRICPDVPLRPIGKNVGLLVRLVDVINCSKFYRNRSRGFDSVKGRSLTIPIGLQCRR